MAILYMKEQFLRAGMLLGEEALEKLEIVQIVLEKGIDDPQVIFESIN